MQLVRFVGRFGFERIAAVSSRSFRQQMRWFGENILISMIVLARNAAALRADTLRRDRIFVLLSRRELRRRYGFARDEAAFARAALLRLRRALGPSFSWE
ncbi:MAG: hypothetical protein WB689_37875 [Xanthobacteraceae bacterium]